MFKNITRYFARAIVAGLLVIASAANGQDAASYINPLIGASSSAAAAGIYHGLGKTFPGATTLYGMVQASPNTITGGVLELTMGSMPNKRWGTNYIKKTDTVYYKKSIKSIKSGDGWVCSIETVK